MMINNYNFPVDALIPIAIFGVGMCISVFCWAYKTRDIAKPFWLYALTNLFDPRFNIKIYKEGPGYLLLIFWSTLAFAISYFLTPYME